MKCDVAIIGGGPAGSTVATLLKRYRPTLDVVVIEREKFPRDHVGESHLPAISEILAEMGVWDKIEAANFPIKIGATYRWGRTDQLWDFEFLAGEDFIDEPRPGKFVGQRRALAFQVDRSIYDKILLDHAREIGCRVLESTAVRAIQRDGDRITGLQVQDWPAQGTSGEPERLEARYYVDCSGEAGIIRKAMGVEVDSPTKLRNIAIWDYYQDATWAVTLGSGGTRIQIMSLGWGWIWFIPISTTRTSVGLVVPAEYFKSTGLSTEEIFLKAIAEEPLISSLLRDARRENALQATKDWSFVAQRLTGENWLLAGDSCGFADPILSAGMTLAHTAGRRAAYTILELERGRHPDSWLKEQYDTWQRRQIQHHIRFADYWYSANGLFTDLQEYCSEIAADAGLKLNADEAFRWLATGGFTTETPGRARALTYSVGGVKFIAQLFSGEPVTWKIAQNNRLRLNTQGAERQQIVHLQDGKIESIPCLIRGDKLLPVQGMFAVVLKVLETTSDAERVIQGCLEAMRLNGGTNIKAGYLMFMEVIETMIHDGWIEADYNPKRPLMRMETPEEMRTMHPNKDNVRV